MAGYFELSLLRLYIFPSDYLCSNSYLLSANGHAVVIDPCNNKLFFQKIKQLKIDYCFLTHEHYDHINGVNELKTNFKCPVICSKICADRIENPRLNMAHYYPAFIKMQKQEPVTDQKMIIPDYCCKADNVFEYEVLINWQGHQFFLRETPGHSPGSSSILLDKKILFSGDTLVIGQKTYTRFPGGNPEDFQQYTLSFLRSLPKETVVYPGHYGSFLLKDAIL
ncbi:MBL fold metallo-hydrolase [bacterium 1XD42-1]|nr:MBL fold metallo-hydrolase [bacterium 1XD42-8]RKJ64577.1 MBL fold metallo-hydrolase [bacterium 1XD42-1]